MTPTSTPVPAPPAEGVLGANFNGNPDSVHFAELEDVSATWLRGFFPMPDADEGQPRDHPSLRLLLDAADRGYGVILSLKFPYTRRPIPAPESPALERELQRLDRILPAVLGKIDILTIGNEPFIESRTQDRNATLNVFYETIARHIIAYRDRHRRGVRTQLFMGALNRLHLPEWRTPATERWMTFVHDTQDLAGVDIHPHLPDPGADQAYLDYVLPRLRPDQKFLATEFSLVLLWRKHLEDRVSPKFRDRYDTDPDFQVWEVIRQAIEQPFTQEKWDFFLTSSPWFHRNRTFLRDQVDRFRATGRLAVATYGVGQGSEMGENFGRDSTPWLLNSLFCPETVQPGHAGLPGRNTTWVEQFRDLQRG